ncbi:class I mannose-6-phosphate isomerase [Populibacterium corticicola]|uniref:Class I mannose-6-phosphate isomerase n=1 Tax=Populibacterium corticicola TaxID=1812826 RepID=A0ABW5XHP9_9MICO
MFQLDRNCPPDRFYRGGSRITAFRHLDSAPEREPEDWVGSTVSLFGEDRVGLSALPNGSLIRDVLSADPEHWFGPEHLAQFGNDPMILTKLLDAGQRLPVHAHPHREFAQAHLGSSHGKAEAWYILTPGEVWLGVARELPRETFNGLVAQQQVDELRDHLHRLSVSTGDIVYVPPGTLHAIGAGVFLVEVQEPTDFSILAEWNGYALDGAADGHLNIGFDAALQAVDLTVRSGDEMRRLVSTTGTLSTEYFRVQHLTVAGTVRIPASYAVVVVLDGEIRVAGAIAAQTWCGGTTWLVAHADGPLTLTGAGDVVFCLPPDPLSEA